MPKGSKSDNGFLGKIPTGMSEGRRIRGVGEGEKSPERKREMGNQEGSATE